MFGVVLPISPLYVEKAVIIPIVRGRCEEAKKNIDSLRDTVSRMREYFIFDIAEYFGVLKERYAPRIAECLGGRLTLDVIYLLDTGEKEVPPEPMHVKLDSFEEMREFDQWIQEIKELPFIPVSVRDLVRFKDIKNSRMGSIPRIPVKEIADRSAGYHYDYIYPDREEMYFRISAERVITTLLSIDEVIERLKEFKETYPNNVEIVYGAVLGFKTQCPHANKGRSDRVIPSQYM